MRPILIACLALAGAPALAGEVCHPTGQVRPTEELKAALTAKGWSVANIKEEKGCYEVYATDETGKRVEIYFDPASFEQMGSDD